MATKKTPRAQRPSPPATRAGAGKKAVAKQAPAKKVVAKKVTPKKAPAKQAASTTARAKKSSARTRRDPDTPLARAQAKLAPHRARAEALLERPVARLRQSLQGRSDALERLRQSLDQLGQRLRKHQPAAVLEHLGTQVQDQLDRVRRALGRGGKVPGTPRRRP